MTMRPAIGCAVIALAIAACGAPAGESPTTETTTTVTTTPGTAQPEDRVDQAIAHLAGRLRVDPVEIEVIRSEEITWSDGSLGCPQPGMSYTQAMVDGYRVILGHDGRIYPYHGAEGPPFLCESDEDDGGYDFVPPPGIDI